MSVVLQTAIDIDAANQEAWAVLSDFPAYGGWSNFSAVEGSPTQGTRIRVRMPGMTFRPILTIVTPEKELEWAAKIATPRLFYGRHNFRLSTNPDGSTQLGNTEEFTGALVLPIQPFFKRDLGPNNGYAGFNLALKSRVELRANR